MLRKIRKRLTVIYVDMDGVLAQWDPNVKKEETYEKDFFLRCKEEPVVSKVIKNLSKKYRVKILSHAYGKDAIIAKKQWLKAIGLGHIDKVFVPYGKPKKDYIWGPGKKVLLDDYSKNLHEWVEGGYIGIKFRNRVNGTSGTWRGPSVRYDMTAKEIIANIEKVIA